MALPRPATNRYSLNIDYFTAHSSSNSNTVDTFQDALKKMDSVIGGIGVAETTSTFGHGSSSSGSSGSKIASLCQQLQSHILSAMDAAHNEIPIETRDFLVNWLTGGDQFKGSPYASQLQKDKETLLLQIHTLERNIELIRTENDHLKRELQGKGHYRTNSGTVSTTLPSYNGPLYDSTNITRGQVGRTSSLTAITGGSGSLTRHTSSSSGLKRQRSFRESFRKAFSRKGNNGKDLTLEGENSSKALNTRAVQFNSLNGTELASWMNSIGLEMYSELISQLVVTGERLASIAANTEDLVRLGVINILHCKKLKLAVEDAIAESPSVLSYLDHHWVADWLVDVGLPQYQQPFLDAKIDGRMLNSLSMEDLAFLNIEHPFHILSMKRAIQAFRLCGYDANYLKLRPDKGGFKLFNWSAHHIIEWMRDIELDDYADKLQGTGISGPVIALEATFTHESIAKAIGISTSKGLIIAHLGEKFLLLIGPTCAQRKVDAMQIKNFVPLNPLDQPIKAKHRKTSKRSKQSHQEETFLCPPTAEVPSINQSDRSYHNLTVSSDTGQRRSAVYSPSPIDQRSHSPAVCPTPPLLHHNSTSQLLNSYQQQQHTGPVAPVAPPIAPVVPPIAPPPPVAPPIASVAPPPVATVIPPIAPPPPVAPPVAPPPPPPPPPLI